VKAQFGKVCVLLVAAAWVLFFGSQVGTFLVIFLRGKSPAVVQALLVIAAVLAAGLLIRLIWPRLTHLNDEPTANSNKATIGIFLLALSLIAFPGTLVFPFLLAAWSGNSDYTMLAYSSMIGAPIFGIMSPVGMYLVLTARRPKGEP
jgi:hypothetical protein